MQYNSRATLYLPYNLQSRSIILCFILSFFYVNFARAQSVIIGSGTNTVGGSNGVPIYRSSSTSTFLHSKSVQLLTTSQLNNAGIPSNATITSWGYKKTNVASISGSNAWTLNVYLKNSTLTSLASGTTWTTMISSATQVYSATVNASNFPSTAGYWMWNLQTPFTYTGGSIECYIEWVPQGTMSSPYSSAAFNFEYTTTGISQAMGTSNTSAIPGTQSTYSTQTRMYNTQIAYSSFPCPATPPVPGATLATVNPVCQNSTTVLSVQNPGLGSGISYQWQESADGVTFNDISGASLGTFTITVPIEWEYRCKVSCINNGTPGFTTPIHIMLNPFVDCYCTSIPSNVADEDIFSVSMTSTSGSFIQTSDCVTPAPGSGSILNRYSNFKSTTPLNAEPGSTVSFSLGLNSCGTSPFNNGTAIWIDYNHNGSFQDAGEKVFAEPTTVSTVPGIGRNLTGNFTIPLNALTGVTAMRIINAEAFTGTAMTSCLTYSYGETEDYVINITAPSLCSGTPNPGNTVASETAVCAGTVVNFSLQNQTSGSGVMYQWEISTDGITYSDIPGAVLNLTTYTVVTSIDMRCRVLCTASGMEALSTPIHIAVNQPTSCYCIPTSTNCTAGDHITYVGFNASTNPINNSSGTCLNNTYSDYTNLTTMAEVNSGEVVSFSVSVHNGGTEYMGMWIDFNQDGDFHDADEFVTAIGILNGSNFEFTGSLTIPLTAANGITRMRVRSKYNSPITNMDACSSFSYGETEDYFIKINACVPSTVTTSVTACNSYTWPVNGITYTAAGTYTDVNGCITNVLNLTFCSNSSVVFDGVGYSNESNSTMALFPDQLEVTGVSNGSFSILEDHSNGQAFDQWYQFSGTAGCSVNRNFYGSIGSNSNQLVASIALTKQTDTEVQLQHQFTTATQLDITYRLNGVEQGHEITSNGSSMICYLPNGGSWSGGNPSDPGPVFDSHIQWERSRQKVIVPGHWDFSVNPEVWVFAVTTWEYEKTTQPYPNFVGGFYNGWFYSVTMKSTLFGMVNGYNVDEISVKPIYSVETPISISSIHFQCNNINTLTLRRNITVSSDIATSTYPGTSVVLSALSNGAATYQWQLNENNIAGATNATYTASQFGSYRVKVLFNSSTFTSSAVRISDNTPHIYFDMASNISANGGQDGQFKLLVIGGNNANRSLTVTKGGATNGNGNGGTNQPDNPNNPTCCTPMYFCSQTGSWSYGNVTSIWQCNTFNNICKCEEHIVPNENPLTWFNGIATATLSMLEANKYIISLQEQNGYIASDEIQLLQPEIPVVGGMSNVTYTTPCSNAGYATLSVTGNNIGSNYVYQWEKSIDEVTWVPVGNGNILTVNCDNQSYFYRCKTTDIVNTNFAYSNNTKVNACGSTTITFTNITPTLCNTGNNGSYTLNISGGCSDGRTGEVYFYRKLGETCCDPNYPPCAIDFTCATHPLDPLYCGCKHNSQLLSNPFSYQEANAYAGTYLWQITDLNGCVTYDSVVVPDAQLVATVHTTPVSVTNGNDGSASVSVTGGAPPYTYAWSNAATTSSITGLSSGNYSLNVSDANGCAAYIINSPSTTYTIAPGDPSPSPIDIGECAFYGWWEFEVVEDIVSPHYWAQEGVSLIPNGGFEHASNTVVFNETYTIPKCSTTCVSVACEKEIYVDNSATKIDSWKFSGNSINKYSGFDSWFYYMNKEGNPLTGNPHSGNRFVRLYGKNNGIKNRFEIPQRDLIPLGNPTSRFLHVMVANAAYGGYVHYPFCSTGCFGGYHDKADFNVICSFESNGVPTGVQSFIRSTTDPSNDANNLNWSMQECFAAFNPTDDYVTLSILANDCFDAVAIDDVSASVQDYIILENISSSVNGNGGSFVMKASVNPLAQQQQLLVPPFTFLWSNGATTPIATYNGAQMYWVSVTDANNKSVYFNGVIETINTIAGTGIAGNVFEPAHATQSQLNHPFGVAINSNNEVYVADYNNHVIKKIASNGSIEIIAGSGVPGFGGDGGLAVNAQLNSPVSITIDKNNTIYFADANYRIRKIDNTGIITTIAGTGTQGYNGDNIPATSAQLDLVFGICVDDYGNVYFSDRYNYRIRKIDDNGIISTIAGNGTPGFYAQDGLPANTVSIGESYGLLVTKSGNVFFNEIYNNRVRMIDRQGNIQTLAGTGVQGYSGDGGLATQATFFRPTHIAQDKQGNFYISDHYNYRIRKIDVSTGVISTYAGMGTAAYSGDGGAALLASLNAPAGMAFRSNGNLVFADALNHVIREINTAPKASLNLQAFIQGYYDLTTHAMQPVLYNSGLNASLTDCDSILVELHDAAFPYAAVSSTMSLLSKDGEIWIPVEYPSISNTYYIVLKTRNAIETWSANPVLIGPTTTYNFTTAASQAYADNQVEVEPGIWAIYSGDISQDGAIDAFDYLLLEPDIIDGNFGYLLSDLNGDGVVDTFDYLVMESNIVLGINMAKP